MRSKSGKKSQVNILFPDLLLNEMDELITNGDAPYIDRSEFVKSAVRKEVDYLERKKAGLIMRREG